MRSNGVTYNATPSIDGVSVVDPCFPRIHGLHDHGPSNVSLSHCLASILSVLSIPFENRHIVVDTVAFIILATVDTLSLVIIREGLTAVFLP